MMYRERTIQFGFGGGLTPVVRNLLIVNAAVWLFQQFWNDFLLSYFALSPIAILNDLAVWQLFSYIFLHGSFSHLFFNMFTLWMFGGEVERTLGSNRFFKYYIATGVGAGLFQLLANWGSSTIILGASGAVYGVLLAFALFFPNRLIMLFFVIPMRARTLIVIYISLSLFLGLQSSVFGTSDGVAHFAHLGGALVGFLILRGPFYYQKILQHIAQRQQEKRQEQERIRQTRISEKRQDIDTILDRINEIGYENISEEEKSYLKEASEYLANEEKINS
jgi:membrane associated rhomboid family serine protease